MLSPTPAANQRSRSSCRRTAVLLVTLTAACEEARPVADGGVDAITSRDAGPVDGSFDGVPVSNKFKELPTAVLFDSAEMPRFDLYVSAADLQKMQADAATWYELDQQGLNIPYVPADMVFGGEYLGRVGLRNKGTTGTLKMCFEGTKQICPKLSLKIKFDEYDDTGRFYGMKRVNMHAMVRDPSMMHERLAYGLFRDAGVLASRVIHSRVYINGKYEGVFAVVEQVEGHLTKEISDNDGNIYKEVWPTSSDSGYYARGLDNNKTTAEHSQFVAFHAALAAAAPEDRPEVVERWAGGDHMLRYMAVLEALRYWDSVMAFYCGGYGCGNHNYYWYQDDQPTGTRFQLIPWDLDNTWALSTIHDGVPAWYAAPVDCSMRLPLSGSPGTTMMPPRCDPLLDGVARMGHDAFAQRISALLDGPFQTDALLAKVDAWAKQIETAVAEDPNYPAGLDGWHGELARLKRDIPLLRQRLIKMRDGVGLKPAGLSLTSTTTFEDVDALDVAMALEFYANVGTDFTAGLNQSSPLVGTADLRLDFEYRNTKDMTAWAQWTQLYVPFLEHATVDLSQVKEIHLRARADSPRDVRFDINSGIYANSDKGWRFGWNVTIGATAMDVVLPMSSIAMPTWAGYTPDVIADVLKQATGIAIHAQSNKRGTVGLIPEGTTDPGYLEIDDVVFVMK